MRIASRVSAISVAVVVCPTATRVVQHGPTELRRRLTPSVCRPSQLKWLENRLHQFVQENRLAGVIRFAGAPGQMMDTNHLHQHRGANNEIRTISRNLVYQALVN